MKPLKSQKSHAKSHARHLRSNNMYLIRGPKRRSFGRLWVQASIHARENSTEARRASVGMRTYTLR
jgi:hypothetical protein